MSEKDPRVRRVALTIPDHLRGHSQAELPLRILVLGDFTLREDARAIHDRGPLDINRSDFDSVMRSFNLSLDLNVPDRLAGSGEMPVSLRFETLTDFRPESIVRQVPEIRVVVDSGRHVGAQLNEILHYPEFQKLESAWRSLWYVVGNTDFSQNIQIEILNVSKPDLLTDFRSCDDWQHSSLFKITYHDIYNILGANPYGLMVSNFEFSHGKDDVALLRELARVAAVAKCPFIGGLAPGMLGADRQDFSDLPKMSKMYDVFEQPQYAQWSAFRESDDSRYVGLTMPRFLLRMPYSIEDHDTEEHGFEEDVRIEDHDRYLWGNTAFALASRFTESFATFAWYMAIVGPHSGGAVKNLPLHRYEADGQTYSKIPTETLISEDMDIDLCNFGFIPLVTRQGATDAAFFDAVSVRDPGKVPTEEGYEDRAKAQLGLSLEWLMIGCRTVHHIKVIWRENIRRVMDANIMVSAHQNHS